MVSVKVCILLAVITCQVSGSVIELNAGPKQCASGIDYWCQDLGTARSCGALKHCIQNVWTYKVPPPDNSSICDLCKEMVQVARDQLESNETQEEIKEVFEGTCRIYFPLKVLADECIRLVDEYIPDLIEELYSMMNPQTVCATAWLCNSNKFLNMIGVSKFEKVSTVCDECVDTATTFINKIKAESDSQFETQLDAVCDSLQSMKTECKMAVEMYGSSLHTTIDNMPPREACQLAGLCDGLPSKPIYQITLVDGTQVSTSLKKLGETPECDFCKTIISHLKDLVTAGSTREEVKDTLLNICLHFGSESDICKTYVNEYFDELYNFLINEIDPDLMCSAFGMCQATVKTVPFTNILPAENEESNSIDWSPVVHPAVIKVPYTHMAVVKKPHSGNVSCALCEFALHELQVLLGDQKTEAAIKSALEQLCYHLPATLTSECQEYVDDYSDLIINLITQEIDPTILCVELGLCTQVKLIMPSLTVKFPMSKMNSLQTLDKVKGFTTCEICNLVISTVESMLEDPATEKDIVHALENVCGLVPKAVYNECTSLIETYGQYALSLIATLADSKQVCQALEVCPRPKGQVELLGGDKCTYGPSYWCRSIYHARACKVEQHCRDKVWK